MSLKTLTIEPGQHQEIVRAYIKHYEWMCLGWEQLARRDLSFYPTNRNLVFGDVTEFELWRSECLVPSLKKLGAINEKNELLYDLMLLPLSIENSKERARLLLRNIEVIWKYLPKSDKNGVRKRAAFFRIHYVNEAFCKIAREILKEADTKIWKLARLPENRGSLSLDVLLSANYNAQEPE